LSDAVPFLLTIVFVSFVINLAIALYGIFARPTLVKKIIALTIFSDSLNSFAIFIGYRLVPHGIPAPPVVVNYTSPQGPEELAKVAVDPLPQALVLTAIVIGLAVTLFMVKVTMQVYRVYGTTSVRKLEHLTAREEEKEKPEEGVVE